MLTTAPKGHKPCYFVPSSNDASKQKGMSFFSCVVSWAWIKVVGNKVVNATINNFFNFVLPIIDNLHFRQ